MCKTKRCLYFRRVGVGWVKWNNEIGRKGGEKERDTQPNAEFQRIPRRDKKAFLSAQRKK